MHKLAGVMSIISLLLFISTVQAETDLEKSKRVKKEFRSGGGLVAEEMRSGLKSLRPFSLKALDGTQVPTVDAVQTAIKIGTNVMINETQDPLALFGRSEITVAADGKNVVAGFNDAQGFCSPEFGGGCPFGNQRGLTGIAFSRDGGKSWTDIGAPGFNPNTNTLLGNIFTLGDPVVDHNGDFSFINSIGLNEETGEFV